MLKLALATAAGTEFTNEGTIGLENLVKTTRHQLKCNNKIKNKKKKINF